MKQVSWPALLIAAGIVIAGTGISAVSHAQNPQSKELSDRGKAADANENGVIDRDEAGGPIAANFDEMDCDKSNTLDGAEIRGFFTGAGCPEPAPAAASAPAAKPLPPLSDRAKAADANENGVIDRDEAGGPLIANFDTMDCDKSNTLDGDEIRGFFNGAGCPKPAAAAAAPGSATAKKPLPPLSDRAKAADANENGVIDRDEAGGPLIANFDTMDCDKSNTLDGDEIRGFFTGAGCPKPAAGGAKPTQQAAKPPQRRAPAGGGGGGGRPPQPVQIDAVLEQKVSQTFPVIGRLVARQSGVIASQVSGAVTEMRVEVGDRVTANDVIAAVSSTRLVADRSRMEAQVQRQEAMIKTAGAELQKTRQELKRLNSLRRSAAFSRARYEDLERDVASRQGTLAERRAQLQEAKAQLLRVGLDIEDTRIRAPFDGVVVETSTEIGSYLNVGAPVARVINDTKIEVETLIPSDRLGGIRQGTPVTVILDDGSRHPAKVRSIIPRENLRTRTRPVRFTADFAKSTKPLADNQSVTVEMPLALSSSAVTVHKDAVVRQQTGPVVYVVSGKFARMRKVTLGDGVGDRFKVLDGLKAGEQVVIRGNERLGRGAVVQVLDRPPVGGAQPRQGAGGVGQ